MSDREIAIKDLNEYLENDEFILEEDTVYAAIAALRAEEEREKGCEYCKNRFGIATHHVTESGMQAGTNKAAAFCPMCGRKLDGGGQE